MIYFPLIGLFFLKACKRAPYWPLCVVPSRSLWTCAVFEYQWDTPDTANRASCLVKRSIWSAQLDGDQTCAWAICPLDSSDAPRSPAHHRSPTEGGWASASRWNKQPVEVTATFSWSVASFVALWRGSEAVTSGLLQWDYSAVPPVTKLSSRCGKLFWHVWEVEDSNQWGMG